MAATATAKSKRTRWNHWWKKERKTCLVDTPDFNQMNTFIEEMEKANDILMGISGNPKMMIQMRRPNYVVGKEEWKDYASIKQYKEALEYGWSDVEFWAHLNPVVYCNVLKKYVEINNTSNWRIDLDFFKVDGELCDSVDKLWDYLKKRNVLLPRLMVRTSINGFHLAYMGGQGYWNINRRLKLCCDILGLKSLPKSKKDIKEKFASMGLDPHQIWSFKRHTIRLPGSVHAKGDRTFVCQGRYNDNYIEDLKNFDDSDVYVIKEALSYDEIERNKAKEARDKNIAASVYGCVHNKLKVAIEEEVGLKSPILDKWVDLFSNNFTGLKKGIFAIPQDMIASEFGISQSAISLHVRSMLKSGVLEVARAHVFKIGGGDSNKARIYKFSKEFLKKYDLENTSVNAKEVEIIESVTEEYDRDSGTLHDQYLSDIRALAHGGIDKELALGIIMVKLSRSGNSRWSNYKREYVDAAYDQYIELANSTRGFDVNKVKAIDYRKITERLDIDV